MACFETRRLDRSWPTKAIPGLAKGIIHGIEVPHQEQRLKKENKTSILQLYKIQKNQRDFFQYLA
jgi:hypothetical protein